MMVPHPMRLLLLFLLAATEVLPLCAQENHPKKPPVQEKRELSPLQKGELRKSGLPEGKESVSIPLKSTVIGYLAKITINGKDLLFIVDTGASSTFIPPKTAETLGLELLKSNGRAITSKGDTIAVLTAVTQRMTLGGAWVENEPIRVVDFPEAITNPLGNGLSCDGILGVSTLADWDVCFNPQENHLRLYPAGKAPALKEEVVLPLVCDLKNPKVSAKNPQGFKEIGLRIPVGIGEHTILALPDSGSGGTFQVSELMAKTVAPEAMANAKPALASGISLSGLTVGSTARLPLLTIGSDKLRNLPVDVVQIAPGSPFESLGLVGMNFLRHYVMTFRFADQKLHLKPLGTVQELTRASTAGLVFNPDFTILSSVPGGPADKAGLKAGDLVLEIQGIPLKTITQVQLRALKQLAPGTSVKIRYKRGDAGPAEVNIVLIKE